MKEAFISLVAFMAICGSIKCHDVGKDGFNFYKDYLRARSEEGSSEGPASSDRMLYFYRTPLQLYPGMLPALEQEYKKRTGNIYKNHMLNKDLWTDESPGKRSSKTALSLMMQSKHPYVTEYPTGDVTEIPYKIYV
ncbi:uncharacterized protein LOC114240011 [Bombyx mandarina]|uniref:Uncharacterized protein LOC114240011 n=1 Tax=Bombyx mandarina TaxID=7092 RepID=A0A6J2J9V6_BOMMA|nr:uncharacterized protein LOC114240011 [Bombyx mandarina]